MTTTMWLEVVLMLAAIIAINVWFWGYTDRKIEPEDEWK